MQSNPKQKNERWIFIAGKHSNCPLLRAFIWIVYTHVFQQFSPGISPEVSSLWTQKLQGNMTYIRVQLRIILDACTKLQKATVRFTVSVSLYHRKQLGSHLKDFHEIWYPNIIRKSVEKIQISLKPDKNDGYFYVNTYVHFWEYLAEFFSEWKMFKTKNKIETNIWHPITFPDDHVVYKIMWKNMLEPDRTSVTI